MKIKIIWGWIPDSLSTSLDILEDYIGLLDDNCRDYEKVLKVIEQNEFEYFRTYNPLFPNYIDDESAKEDIFIFENGKLKALKEFPAILYKLEVMGPGELLCDTNFEWEPPLI